jgi:hypothetical protein
MLSISSNHQKRLIHLRYFYEGTPTTRGFTFAPQEFLFYATGTSQNIFNYKLENDTIILREDSCLHGVRVPKDIFQDFVNKAPLINFIHSNTIDLPELQIASVFHKPSHLTIRECYETLLNLFNKHHITDYAWTDQVTKNSTIDPMLVQIMEYL